MGSGSVLSMPSEVPGVAGDTLTTSRLTKGTTNQRSIGCAVTHLTIEASMDLACSDKRSCSRGMAANSSDAGCRGWGQRCWCLYRSGVTMGMAIEECAMAGLAVIACDLADRATKQNTGSRVVAGLTAKARMGRMVSTGHHIGCGIIVVAAQAQGWSGSHVMAVRMAIEIAAAMAGLTVTTTGRHGRGLAVGRL